MFCFLVVESFLRFPLVKFMDEDLVAFSLLYVSCTFLRQYLCPWWDGQNEMAPTNEGRIGPFYSIYIYNITLMFSFGDGTTNLTSPTIWKSCLIETLYIQRVGLSEYCICQVC